MCGTRAEAIDVLNATERLAFGLHRRTPFCARFAQTNPRQHHPGWHFWPDERHNLHTRLVPVVVALTHFKRPQHGAPPPHALLLFRHFALAGAEDGLGAATCSIRTTFEPDPLPSLDTYRRPHASKSTLTGRNPSGHAAPDPPCFSRSIGSLVARPSFISTYTTL